jgi:hypothetical protein
MLAIPDYKIACNPLPNRRNTVLLVFRIPSPFEKNDHVRRTNDETLLSLRHSRHRRANRNRKRNRGPTNLHSQTTQQLQRQNHHLPPRRCANPPPYPSQPPIISSSRLNIFQSLRLHPPQHPPPRRLLRNRRLHSLRPRRPRI